MTKREFVHRLTLTALGHLRYDSIHRDRYAVAAARNAQMAADDIEKEHGKSFFDKESRE